MTVRMAPPVIEGHCLEVAVVLAKLHAVDHDVPGASGTGPRDVRDEPLPMVVDTPVDANGDLVESTKGEG